MPSHPFGKILHFSLLVALIPALSVGCGEGEVNNEHSARQAYLGLDGAVDRALRLALLGYNAASSANISDQTEAGDESGTMVVGGKVDAGASANKVITVTVALDEYSDGFLKDEDDKDLMVVYYTDTEAEAESDDLPILDLKLNNMPNGTFAGTFIGRFRMEGDLLGEVTLDLAMAGDIEEIEDSGGDIRRKSGTVSITGTATSRYGVFDVNLEI